MNIASKWKELAAIIDAGIKASPDGVFPISIRRLHRTHRLTDEQIHKLLMLNYDEERFAVEEWQGDYQFRSRPTVEMR